MQLSCIIPSGTFHNILCQGFLFGISRHFMMQGFVSQSTIFIQETFIWWPPRRWGSQHWREAMEPLDVRNLAIYETPRGDEAGSSWVYGDWGFGRWQDVRTCLDVVSFVGLEPLDVWCRVGAGRCKEATCLFKVMLLESCLADERIVARVKGFGSQAKPLENGDARVLLSSHSW